MKSVQEFVSFKGTLRGQIPSQAEKSRKAIHIDVQPGEGGEVKCYLKRAVNGCILVQQEIKILSVHSWVHINTFTECFLCTSIISVACLTIRYPFSFPNTTLFLSEIT